MKTYAYLRISTEKQTFAQQLNTINNYLKLKGLTIDETFSDEGVSGGVSYKNRNLYELINEMHEGDALVVSEISRLGRSMSDLNKLVNDEMKPRKLRLIIISMNLDLDCANLKAIDEMILFAFSFASQTEKELIQERTKSALEARKKKIAEQGYFISKKGNRCEKLGGSAASLDNAIDASIKVRRDKAMKNPNNAFFLRFIESYEKRNGKLEKPYTREKMTTLANQLNELGQKTSTGMPYNVQRMRSMLSKRENWLLVK